MFYDRHVFLALPSFYLHTFTFPPHDSYDLLSNEAARAQLNNLQKNQLLQKALA